MKQYSVTGMSCAACSARVEKAVLKVPGVSSVAVSLLTNSMGVEGSANPADVIKAVEEAGYGAAEKATENAKQTTYEKELSDTQTPLLVKRLVVSVFFTVILMYVSMGHMMWGWPLPRFFDNNHVAMGLTQLLLAGIVMVINQRFFVSGFKGVIHGAPNMDTLVAMGSGVSFIYSTYVLFAMTAAQVQGGVDAAMEYMHDFYFETAAMILTLITVGKLLEARSKGRTTDAIKSLMKLAPQTAVLVIDGVERTVPIDQVKKGDVFVVRPGENIPVDGVVLEGHSAVNEAALTGESIPADKNIGDSVFSATTNQSGFLRCEATKVGEDTTLAGIIRLVNDAAATKAPIAKIADKVSGVFVPVVIGIALVTALVWLISGSSAGYALARGIAVLVISCPCALGLATPVAIMVGNGLGARNGILFKTAAAEEECAKVQIVALDKTGTITLGEPTVTDIYAEDEAELLRIAYGLEQKSEHPLARAVVKYASEKGLEALEVTDFKAEAGNGLCAVFDGKKIYGGNRRYIEQFAAITPEVLKRAENFADEGKTALYFAIEDSLLGVIAVADVIKEDSPKAVQELRNMGIRVVMLTGDNRRTAEAIGKQIGATEVIAEVLPEGKDEVIRKLQTQGKVAMVGDGINDAPALTRADIGIAIGAGADVAIDAADVVLMKNSLSDVPAAVRLSRATLRNIKENLFWAFFYNSIGIPLAAGLFIPLFGWELNPMFGAAAMSLSSFCVVSNALRLNLFRVHDARHDKKINSKRKVEKSMEKTMRIEGMMCGHCEARVKKTLEAIDGVVSAEVSHEKGTAVVTLSKEVADEVLKAAVEAQDYKVL